MIAQNNMVKFKATQKKIWVRTLLKSSLLLWAKFESNLLIKFS